MMMHICTLHVLIKWWSVLLSQLVLHRCYGKIDVESTTTCASVIRLIDWAFERSIIYVYNIWCRNEHIWKLKSQHQWFTHAITVLHKTLPLPLRKHSLFLITTAPCLPVVIAVTKMGRSISVIQLHGLSKVSLNFRFWIKNRLEISMINRWQLSVHVPSPSTTGTHNTYS